jgi:hypothetical protein
MDQACWNAGNASGITGPPHDTGGPHLKQRSNLEKGRHLAEEKENNSLNLLVSDTAPLIAA